MARPYLILLLALVFSIRGVPQEYRFRDPSLSLNVRVDDLVSRMTLQEKSSQMLYNSAAIERLGIPAYNWWNECLHGVARAGRATVFPEPIGLAATFDDSLVYRIGTAISDEARAKHAAAVRKGNTQQYTGLSFWTPNINIFRDPRWGRGQETYGEDPCLTSVLGVALVRGLQGPDPLHLKVAACAKHFVVHSGPEKSRHEFNALPDERDFRETYLPAFKALVDAGVEAVMCAYNRVYNEPCCGSKLLLVDILRNEWGFKGHIVSDCWALYDFITGHKVVKSGFEAAALAAKAGVNLNCGVIYQDLPEAVEKGLIDEKTVDADLKPLLTTRFRLNLIDPSDPGPWASIPPEVVNCEKHIKLAYEAAVKSVVLLKNNGILPLDRDTLKNLLVCGPMATDIPALRGNYNGLSGNFVTILEGIINKADIGTVVEDNPGFILNSDSSFQGFWQASRADAVIICIGINPLFEGEEGEAMYNPEGGDRTKIELPGNQVKYVKMMREKNPHKPLIVIVTGGSAIAMPEVTDLADALLFVWYPGEQGGNAVADILFGNANPSGRLPVTFYRSTGDLPAFDDYSMKDRTYRYFTGKPLFPFGFGLSYTSFRYGDLQSDHPSYSAGDTIRAEFAVTNSGSRAGDEVVQLYIREKDSGKPVPLRSLKGFKRISLKPGETQKVSFSLPVKELAYWVPEHHAFEVEPGIYILEAAASSADIRLMQEIIVK
ncbi:MAG TPA: glycoside hydrolase family 3 N-terminal domain-containing protein [Bacteroidales bacterium]|nr:glycoside hydrolase family 3 N-terminal domain-containing protein [Bacteroidales bacterium]